jgi:hypothetical protein
VDALATTVLVARFFNHWCTYASPTQTPAAVRFAFFVQFVCFLWLVGIIVVTHAGTA